eukprot:GHVL01017643.1.p1 GENE.GHVL01017643.1~~GHVL01017643.1.p1  ORF type:complete len:240 (-),score=87.22 GHVL01017643.1:126-845(-)
MENSRILRIIQVREIEKEISKNIKNEEILKNKKEEQKQNLKNLELAKERLNELLRIKNEQKIGEAMIRADEVNFEFEKKLKNDDENAILNLAAARHRYDAALENIQNDEEKENSVAKAREDWVLIEKENLEKYKKNKKKIIKKEIIKNENLPIVVDYSKTFYHQKPKIYYETENKSMIDLPLRSQIDAKMKLSIEQENIAARRGSNAQLKETNIILDKKLISELDHQNRLRQKEKNNKI